MRIFWLPKILFTFFLRNKLDCASHLAWLVVSSGLVLVAKKWGAGYLVFPAIMASLTLYWAAKDFITWYISYGGKI